MGRTTVVVMAATTDLWMGPQTADTLVSSSADLMDPAMAAMKVSRLDDARVTMMAGWLVDASAA